MKTILKSLITAITLLGLAGFTQAHALDSAEPKAIGLLFYSDACGSCKILDPNIQAVKEDFATQPILFATFDHSNTESRNQAALLAASLGVAKLYDEQQKASGYMLIVDPKTGKILQKLTKTDSQEAIKAAFNMALKS
ncbi:MAG: thioredoxin domain-containing protein [Verrucomicrobiota bacterium]